MKIKIKENDKWVEQEVTMDLDNITNETGELIEKLQAEKAGCFQPDFQKQYDVKKKNPDMTQEEIAMVSVKELDLSKLREIEDKIYRLLVNDAYGLKGKKISYLGYLNLVKEMKKADPLKMEADKEKAKEVQKKAEGGGK